MPCLLIQMSLLTSDCSDHAMSMRCYSNWGMCARSILHSLGWLVRPLIRQTCVHGHQIRQVSTGASTTCDPTATQPCTSATTASGSGTSTEELCCDATTSSVTEDPDAPRPITRQWAESAVPWNKVLNGKSMDGEAPAGPVAPVASSKCDFLTDKDCPLGNGSEPFERKLQDASKIIKMLKVMALEEVVSAWKGFVDKVRGRVAAGPRLHFRSINTL